MSLKNYMIHYKESYKEIFINTNDNDSIIYKPIILNILSFDDLKTPQALFSQMTINYVSATSSR